MTIVIVILREQSNRRISIQEHRCFAGKSLGLIDPSPEGFRMTRGKMRLQDDRGRRGLRMTRGGDSRIIKSCHCEAKPKQSRDCFADARNDKGGGCNDQNN